MNTLRIAALGSTVAAFVFLATAAAAPPTAVPAAPPVRLLGDDDDDVTGDILDLVARAVIEALAEGDRISSVAIKVRPRARYANRTVTVRVPPGLMFTPDKSHQRMMNTRGGTVTLRGGDWERRVYRAVCTNIEKDVPGRDQTFEIKRGEGFWRRFAKELAEGAQDYVVEQAATWIASEDNADYKKLGTLVNGLTQQRLIGPNDAARALKFLSDAGYDITKTRKLYRDRATWGGDVTDPRLREWLQDQ